MTKGEYLTARGWFWRTEVNAVGWSDGLVDCCSLEEAVMVQLALDAAEERAAWVQFAAAIIDECHGEMCAAVSDAARIADAMLAEYRKRFAFEPTP